MEVTSDTQKLAGYWLGTSNGDFGGDDFCYLDRRRIVWVNFPFAPVWFCTEDTEFPFYIGVGNVASGNRINGHINGFVSNQDFH